MRKICLLALAMVLTSFLAAAAEIIQLPAPVKSGGVTLTQALSLRKSSRNFADVDLDEQQLSNLLWAAAGVNREDGRKVYPTAINRQDMVVYVINRRGVYRYSPEGNCLELLRGGGSSCFDGGAAVCWVGGGEFGLCAGYGVVE